jgi:dihydroorotate dehydrogenase electron transfer subunit
VPFPFTEQPASLALPGSEGRAQGADRAHALLEGWGVPNRLASASGLPGAFPGYVTDLAAAHLEALSETERAGAALFAVGPEPMLRATAALARRLALPAWVSLEEHMACAVGGCAGCVVRVAEPEGPAMRRVCVDGPVFPAERVYPAGE